MMITFHPLGIYLRIDNISMTSTDHLSLCIHLLQKRGNMASGPIYEDISSAESSSDSDESVDSLLDYALTDSTDSTEVTNNRLDNVLDAILIEDDNSRPEFEDVVSPAVVEENVQDEGVDGLDLLSQAAERLGEDDHDEIVLPPASPARSLRVSLLADDPVVTAHLREESPSRKRRRVHDAPLAPRSFLDSPPTAVVPCVRLMEEMDARAIPHHSCTIRRCPTASWLYVDLIDWYMGHYICPLRSLNQWGDMMRIQGGFAACGKYPNIVGLGKEYYLNNCYIRSGLHSLVFNLCDFLRRFEQQLFHPEHYFFFGSRISRPEGKFCILVHCKVRFRPKVEGRVVVEDFPDMPPPILIGIGRSFTFKESSLGCFNTYKHTGKYLSDFESSVKSAGYTIPDKECVEVRELLAGLRRAVANSN